MVDLREHAERIAGMAGRAPSHHNAQPWAFRVLADAVEVFADPGRQATVADPDGRQLLLGVGAAVFVVRLELAALGMLPRTVLLPDPDRPELAAVVRAGGRYQAGAEEARLRAQVPRRRTVRGPMRADLPEAVRRELGRQAALEGGFVEWLESGPARAAVAALVRLAERDQQHDPRFVAELAHWVDPTAAGQGIPPVALGPAAAAGHAAEFAFRDFAGGAPRAVTGRPPEPRPVVAVFGTRGDGPADRLRGGQALMRLLLAATAQGLAASYFNQPLESVGLRRMLSGELRLPGCPQLIMRLGRPALPAVLPQTPRRAPSDLLRP